MKKFNVFAILSLSFLAATSAQAGSTCMGQTSSGKIVTVSIPTHGTMAFTGSGKVEIKDRDGKMLKTYPLARTDIAQYFEGCRGVSTESDGCLQANIGLSAYIDTGASGSVWINFIGTDYQDVLESYLLNPSRKPDAGNSMRVWKGEGGQDFDKDYYSFKDIVCQMDHDV